MPTLTMFQYGVYTYPSSAGWTLPANNTYPQLILSSGLKTLFGFSSQTTFPLSQTVPSTAVNVSYISDTYPIISPTFCYILTCNLIESKLSIVPNLFFQIPLAAGFGSLISQTLPSSNGLTVIPTIFNYIEITTLDQNYNTLILKDPEASFSLILEVEE